MICGRQGLSNPDVTLRTRSCYFLTKLVKAMREGVVQYVDVIVPGVQGEYWGWGLGRRGGGHCIFFACLSRNTTDHASRREGTLRCSHTEEIASTDCRLSIADRYTGWPTNRGSCLRRVSAMVTAVKVVKNLVVAFAKRSPGWPSTRRTPALL